MKDRAIFMGLDIGFRKTGVAVFSTTKEKDELIFATTVQGVREELGSTMEEDIFAVLSQFRVLDSLIKEHQPCAIFMELPHGGAQSSRAARCMGLATSMAAGLMFMNLPTIGFELFIPNDVEKAIGIWLSRSDAKDRGLKKGELTKWKKQRSKEAVVKAFPDFKGWPKTIALAEDAYDAAAAFMAGRAIAKQSPQSSLYYNIKKVL